MEYYSLRSALQNETGMGEMTNADEYLDRILIVVKNMLFQVDARRFENFQLADIVTSAGGFTFKWESTSKKSKCPRCGAVSEEQRHTYKARILIDEPILGMPVMHCLREKVYICAPCGEAGEERSFVEDISVICRRPFIKTTTNLDEKIVNEAILRSANGLASDYKESIHVSASTILNRVKEAGGMVTEKNLTDTNGVEILSVDDNNGRKGNSSSACTVVVDVERHIILVVANGANSEVAKEIFDRFPDAIKLSRDRDCAYAKAGRECKLEQTADIFHLILNAHEAVKEAISKGLDYNIYVKEGDGWVELPVTDTTQEISAPSVAGTPQETSAAAETARTVTTLTDGDITQRVGLACLSAKQEKKNRTVIELLRLQDQGLSAKEIDNRLGITPAIRIALFSNAADVICGVEEKIDNYYANPGQRKCRQKTIGKNSRPSSGSIVEPYSEIVMKMVNEGHNHRTIYPVIQKLGYAGSANAIYQYILKKRFEAANGNPCVSDDETIGGIPEGVPPRPPRITIQRTTKTAVYRFVLRETAIKREDALAAASNDTVSKEAAAKPAAQEEGEPPNKPSQFYSPIISNIIMGANRKAEGKKN